MLRLSDANRIANDAPAWLGGLVYAWGALRALAITGEYTDSPLSDNLQSSASCASLDSWPACK